MEKIKQITLFYLKKEQKRDILTSDAPVAQLDRASASGVEGRGFESRRVYQIQKTFRKSGELLRIFYYPPPPAELLFPEILTFSLRFPSEKV